jgi:hypothetical protein
VWRYIQCELISFKKTCFHVAGFIVVHPVDMFFLKESVLHCSVGCVLSNGIHFVLLPFFPYFTNLVFGLYYRKIPNRRK